MSVCIVGNSNELLSQELGEKIDSHDVVIRINDFLIKGFEKHVGKKTTILAAALNPKSILTEEAQYALKVCDVWLVQKGDHRYRHSQKLGIKPEKISIISDHVYHEICKKVRGTVSGWKCPSTGATTIAMALDIFKNDTITIAGFDQNGGHEGKGHYYKDYIDKVQPGNRCGHDWDEEVKFINHLALEGVLSRLT